MRLALVCLSIFALLNSSLGLSRFDLIVAIKLYEFKTFINFKHPVDKDPVST